MKFEGDQLTSMTVILCDIKRGDCIIEGLELGATLEQTDVVFA